MSLTIELNRYLSVRRSLGYDLRTAERILRRFTRFAEHEGAVHINTALFLRWHATLAEACPSTRGARLTVVRLFAQWLSSFDPVHEVPPQGLLPSTVARCQTASNIDPQSASKIDPYLMLFWSGTTGVAGQGCAAG